MQTYPSLHLHGFTDFDYMSSDEPHGTTGFDLGQLVLHSVSQLGRKLNHFGEISARVYSGIGLPARRHASTPSGCTVGRSWITRCG